MTNFIQIQLIHQSITICMLFLALCLLVDMLQPTLQDILIFIKCYTLDHRYVVLELSVASQHNLRQEQEMHLVG